MQKHFRFATRTAVYSVALAVTPLSSAWSFQYQPEFYRALAVGHPGPPSLGGSINVIHACTVDDNGIVTAIVSTTTSGTDRAILRADGFSPIATGDSVQYIPLAGGAASTTISGLITLDTDSSGVSLYLADTPLDSGADSVGRDGSLLIYSGGRVLTDTMRQYDGTPGFACAGGAGMNPLYALFSTSTHLIPTGSTLQLLERGAYTPSGDTYIRIATRNDTPFGGSVFLAAFATAPEQLVIAPNGRCAFRCSLGNAGSNDTALVEYDPLLSTPGLELLAQQGGALTGAIPGAI